MSNVPAGQESRHSIREQEEKMVAAYDAAVIARDKHDWAEAKAQVQIFTKNAESLAWLGQMLQAMCDAVTIPKS